MTRGANRWQDKGRQGPRVQAARDPREKVAGLRAANYPTSDGTAAAE